MHQLVIHNGNWARTIARVIAGLWAGFWMFFGIASGIGERLTLVGVLMHVLLPGLIFVGIAAFAWRWQLHGSIVLMLSGIIVMIAYPLLVKARFPLSTIFFVLLTMAIPPLVSGALLFFDAKRNENRFQFKTED